ncbi:MAG: GAF domain-containing protein [Proteobacteria bacterium]|nr:GAF domain-containing protein [Pseudomonadota bacterium]
MLRQEVAIGSLERDIPDTALLEGERRILARVAKGGPLNDVLRDLILLVEQPSHGDMLASILVLSQDGTRLLEGAAPSLPAAYNAAINGIPVGNGIGSCGTAAFTGESVFVADIATDPLWKDFRDLACEHGLAACWSVPLKSSDGQVLGTFANYYRVPRVPTGRDIIAIETVAQTAAIAIERHRAEMARSHAEEQRKMLLHELNHRVKNAFALAGALITVGARTVPSAAELAASVQGKLASLSRAHDLLVDRLSATDGTLADASLRDLVASAFAPYTVSPATQARIEGPDLRISSHALSDLALLLHELATNAAKYGAWSDGDGEVELRWVVNDNVLRFDWHEQGGPIVVPPSNLGFGSTLTRRIVEKQYGGTIDFDWHPRGLNIAITLPLPRIVS